MDRPGTRLLCIVIPCFDEEQVIEQTYEELSRVLRDLSGWRAITYFVDDGSTDSTLFKLNALARRDDAVRVLSLSRNFGHQAAITAGMDYADRRADAVLVMDADLENPPSLIPKMLAALERDHDVVFGVREGERHVSAWKRLLSRSFYALFNRVSDVRIEPGAPEFFVLSRRAREALARMPERHRFLRGMVSWLGFPRVTVAYRPPARAAGASKYTLTRMLKLAADALFAFSSAPVRLVFFGSALCFVSGVLLSTASLARAALSLSVPAPLWVGALVLLSTALQLGASGVVAGYISRVLDESRGRPLYLVSQEPEEAVRKQEPLLLNPRTARRASNP